MIVCLDSGNSRIKWGVHDGHALAGQGAVAVDHADVGATGDLAPANGRKP
jgi:type III pantothenate kinase